MKKILVLIISFIFIGACAKPLTAKEAVENYLEKYRTSSKDVLEALDDYVASDNDLSENQKEVYKEVLKKQYKNIKYKIANETYTNDEALITTEITVFDLYKAQKEADDYLKEHQSEFYTIDGVYDKSKFLDYKLSLMKDYTYFTDYTIDFHVVKDDKDRWEVKDLSKSDLEKLHGIYQYET